VNPKVKLNQNHTTQIFLPQYAQSSLEVS